MSSAGSKDVTGWTQAPSNTARASYDQDEFGWLLEQASLLRDGRLDEIDHHTLAEFLTDMALMHRHAFRSAMAILLQYMLKVLVQPEKITRSWRLTISVQQDHARVIIKDNPGMRRYVPELYADAYSAARRFASDDTGIEIDRFPEDNPWSLDEALTFVPPAPPPRGRKVTRKG